MTMPDFKQRLTSATNTMGLVEECTRGRLCTHFYNVDGVQIRGWQENKTKRSFKHPLEIKYGDS